ncbi:hypothetical protein [Acidovorax sp. GBBC 3334]|nr:hypothetical protein [Acidovorax sp. GBBC 3334]
MPKLVHQRGFQKYLESLAPAVRIAIADCTNAERHRILLDSPL